MMLRRDFPTTLLGATAALALTRTALAQPTSPGAIPSSVYLAMATKGALFLENTARDAFDKTASPRLKKLARAEVVEQVTLARKIGGYTGGGVPVPAGPRGPGGLVGAPVAIAGTTVGAAEGVAGGIAGLAPPMQGMTTDEQKARILSQLAGMQPGPPYDATFVGASVQDHQEAFGIHRSSAQSGDDPGLRRIARGAPADQPAHLPAVANASDDGTPGRVSSAVPMDRRGSHCILLRLQNQRTGS